MILSPECVAGSKHFQVTPKFLAALSASTALSKRGDEDIREPARILLAQLHFIQYLFACENLELSAKCSGLPLIGQNTENIHLTIKVCKAMQLFNKYIAVLM